MGQAFQLPIQYELRKPIGDGANGIVVAAKDLNDDNEEPLNLVAVKKIHNAFEHKIFAMRTLRELKTMRVLNHENVLSIKSLLLPNSLEEFKEIYVVTELMETDLGQIIKSNEGLSDDHI